MIRFLPYLIVGGAALLRLLYPLDIEFKLDESYMWDRVRGVLEGHEPWPLLGMPSGVGLRNPGLSIWFFIGIGWTLKQFAWLHPLVFSPVGLSLSVGLLNVAAIVLLLKVMGRQVKTRWISWSIAAITAFNPLAVLMQRKIWAQSVLPLFCMGLLYFWKERAKRPFAFTWGLLGCLMGQVHMSGFFFAPALALTQLYLDFRASPQKSPRWLPSWILGSGVGALGLLPWVPYLLNRSSHVANARGWEEAIQLKYWVFGLTNPFGLHLGNTLGVHLGPSPLQQLSDFLLNPFMSFFYGVILVMIAGAAGKIIYTACVARAPSLATPLADSPLISLREFYQEWKAPILTSLLTYGVLLTLTGIAVRRYYLVITFPFEALIAVGLYAAATRSIKKATWLVALTCLCFFGLSLGALHYVHKNEGAINGDFGPSFSKSLKAKNQP